MLGIPFPLHAADTTALDAFSRIHSDADLVAGFEGCPAPPAVYARLQDELLFAIGAEALSPELQALAGVDPRGGVGGLLVAVRGQGRLGIVPATRADASLPESTPGATLRRLSDRQLAYGDLTLLASRAPEPTEAALPPLLRELPANRCAWVFARPGWLRDPAEPPSADADVHGRSLLRCLRRLAWMAVTADYTSEIEVRLLVVAADSEDAALLADALREFLAGRRRNPDAPVPVRDAVERGTVERRAETVTLRLPLSQAALERIRRNQDSRSLLRLRLEDLERERWQKVAAIVRELDLLPGSRVADIGAGEGFFSVRLARAVGSGGRVFAVEIGEKAVAALSRRARAASLDNLEALLGAPDDPRLPAPSLDAALIVNAYHEMPFHEAMLGHLFESLKPGGRLVLVEPWSPSRRGEPRADQVRDHVIAPELVEAELRRAGFAVEARRDEFVSTGQRREWLIRVRRPWPG